jgi:serine/threonine protein kinase
MILLSFFRLLYRDIKPENIGFDIRGDVKLFDFGLMKSLERSNKIKDSYGYKLSGKTGSIPYMAPEVALGKPYDREADVYSFAVLLWEIVSLDWAYNGYDTRQYFIQVCAHNQRLPVKRSWPAMVRVIIEEGWDPNPQKRPNMSRIGTLLRGELADLTSDNAILNRTQHLMNKSRRSRHFLDNSRQGRRGSGMGGSSGGRRSSVGLDGSTNGRRTSMKGDRSTRDMFLGGDVCGTSDNP